MSKHPFAAFAAAVGAVLTASQTPVPPSLLARLKQSLEEIEGFEEAAADGAGSMDLAGVKADLVEQLLADGEVAKAMAERLVAEITATQSLVDRLLERMETPVLAGVDAYMAEKHPPRPAGPATSDLIAAGAPGQGPLATSDARTAETSPAASELPLTTASDAAPAAGAKKKA